MLLLIFILAWFIHSLIHLLNKCSEWLLPARHYFRTLRYCGNDKNKSSCHQNASYGGNPDNLREREERRNERKNGEVYSVWGFDSPNCWCGTHKYGGLTVVPFLIRDLSISGFWYPWRFWNQSLSDTEGWLQRITGGDRNNGKNKEKR